MENYLQSFANGYFSVNANYYIASCALYLSQTENQKKTISGFENLLGTIKLVYFANGIENDCHIFLLENGYQIYEYKTSNTNHVYGECYYLKKS